MRCRHCPLFEYYESEDGSYANCGLFGDDWENQFQYEDKEGTTIGCYIEKCYIMKRAKEVDEYYASCGRDYDEETTDSPFPPL